MGVCGVQANRGETARASPRKLGGVRVEMAHIDWVEEGFLGGAMNMKNTPQPHNFQREAR